MRKAAFLVLVLAALTGAAQQEPEPQTPGDAWLAATDDERQAFIASYILGFDQGFYNGAYAAAQKIAIMRDPKQVAQQVFESRQGYSKSLETYERIITGFYQRNPDLREAQIGWVMAYLNDGGSGLNAEAIEKIRQLIWQHKE